MASPVLQRRAENSESWSKLWDPGRGAFVGISGAVGARLPAKRIKQAGWSVAFPRRPWKVSSTREGWVWAEGAG